MNMKKKKLIPVLIAALAVTMVLGGCGSNKNNSSSSAESENRTVSTREIIKKIGYRPRRYVKLMDGYDSIAVTLTGNYTATNSDIKSYAESMMASYPNYVKTDDQTVDKGDIVNIDYKGTIKGKAFDGGTAEDQYLEIGSKTFIDGFEDGLKGHKVGETVTLHLKFDKDYSNSELAGKKVTFKVKINYIAKQKKITYDTLTNAYVKKNFSSSGISTVKEFKAQCKSAVQNQMDSQKTSDTQTQVLSTLEKECDVTLPDGLLDDRLEEANDNLKAQAKAADLSVSKYLSQYYGMTQKQYNSQAKKSLKESLTQELILQAIVQKDKITFETDDFNTFVNQYVNYYGTDKKTFYKEYGGEDRVMVSYAENLALQKCVSGAKVTVKSSDDSSSSSGSSTSGSSSSSDSSSTSESSSSSDSSASAEN